MLRIIVVDDQIDALKRFLEGIIDEEKVDYHFFHGGFAGIISYARRIDFDAAFLDINMPEGSGIDLAKKLIAIKKDIKIAFVTGLDIDPETLPSEVKERTVGFLFKPYSESSLARIISSLKGMKRKLKAKMFGNFDCFIDGRRISFSSSKSKELLALLLSYEGKSLSMNDAISKLWPDHDIEKAKILYRDAVWRLRKTLQEAGVECVNFLRAQLEPVISLIECDYWDFLKGEDAPYRGEFCLSYEWAMDCLPYLDHLDMKRKGLI